MPLPHASRTKQHGVALLLALLVVALATIAAVDMTLRQQLDIRRAGNVLLNDQAYLYALAAESYALHLLGRPGPDRELPWDDCVSPTLPVALDDALLEVWVEDLHCRVNLNALAGSDVIMQSFVRWLSLMNAEHPELYLQPESLARAIKDWLNPQTDEPYYRLQNPPYLSANQAMLSPTELRLVQGVNDDIWQALAPYVTALPGTDLALNLEYADDTLQIAFSDLPQQEAGASTYYRLNVSVSLADKRLFLCSVLDTQQGRVLLREQQLCGL
ncbi:type II secretion system minor pseudopilin GspK [Thiorhodospira sibirica]|uniref:type II secretion system minor pseudopilin GspK n=1 Tax=Thiorhodospira sibirica TaxID=154347 RepID=UPI00022C1756|nr:type II secretion system minor pseudopilin GspK [Thiorhodospira sibirica]